MDIDFMIACTDISSATQIAPHAEQLGYTTEINVDEEDQSVTCYCMKRMLLHYDALIAAQSELDSIARARGGYIDGWGTLGNAADGAS